MLPTLKSSIFISVDTDLLEFRRILLDYDKGLRWNGPWNSRRSDGNAFTSNHAPNCNSDRNKGPSTGKTNERDTTKHPKPCKCGGMHCYRDCIERTTGTRSINIFQPSSFVPKKLPTTWSRWPSSDNKPRNTSQVHPERQANIVSTRFEDVDVNVIDLSLPEHDKGDYEQLYSSICNNSFMREPTLQNRHSDKVPTFAMAKTGGKEGAAHEVCIDTGSAISLLDSQYLKRNFPHIKVNPASTIMLKEVGSNQTHGWMNAVLHFIKEERVTPLSMALFTS